jgi:hypothetical protein
MIVAFPCQEFSYRAMPWKRAKALGPPELGMELFAQAGRIQREACEAAGRYIPMIQENVKGAQKYVGRAQWHYGSFYLWGDVPALMPVPYRAPSLPGMNWSGSDKPGYKAVAFNDPRHHERATKNAGGSWFNVAHNTTSGKARNPDGRKQGGDWFSDPNSGPRQGGHKSMTRKAASAKIAKIPFPLARYIAQVARETAHREAA